MQTFGASSRALGILIATTMMTVASSLGWPSSGEWRAPEAAAVEVIADDELDQYSGSGAVIWPSSITASSRQRGATCAGCRWKVTMPCKRDGGLQDAGCRGIVLGCPQGREIQRAWLARAGGDFEPVGLFCPTDGGAVSVADATEQVRGSFTRRLPSLRPSCDPPRGVLARIPVHCRSGQPSARVQWEDEVAGLPVRTSARGRWVWTFATEDGRASSLEATEPGAGYPAPGVRHAFPVPGMNSIAVEAIWIGEFTVDGLGPFPVEQPVRQRAELRVPTGSALGVIRP